MINFNCSHCGHAISIEERHAGRKGKCNSCGKVLVVPGSYDDVAVDLIGAPPPSPPPPRDSAAIFEESPPPAKINSPVPEQSKGEPPPVVPHNSKLKPCPDCTKLVSQRAATCPHCGCPISAPPPMTLTPPLTDWTARRASGSWIFGAISFLGLFYFAFVFDTTVPIDEPPYRVHNSGLMNDRLAGMIFFGIMAVRSWIPDTLEARKLKDISTRLAIVVLGLVVLFILMVVYFSTDPPLMP